MRGTFYLLAKKKKKKESLFFLVRGGKSRAASACDGLAAGRHRISSRARTKGDGSELYMYVSSAGSSSDDFPGGRRLCATIFPPLPAYKRSPLPSGNGGQRK